tara:strand:+ start:129 stop:881 length:753 start_codon:yes stop_codon:yes gene_type:complete
MKTSGNFYNNDRILSAKAITPSATINATTKLNKASLYVGTTGNVKAIMSTTLGGLTTALAVTSNGLTYITANGVATISDDASAASGLTVNTSIPVPTTNAIVAGSGYTVSAFTVTGGSGTGLSGTIDSVNAGAITGFTILQGGLGYKVGDVLTIVSGDGISGVISLSSAPNSVMTVTVAVAGTGYKAGETVSLVGGDGLAVLTITSVNNTPIASQAVEFIGVQAGTYLPVVVDYVLPATATAAGSLLATY